MDIYDMYQATLWVERYVVDTNLSNRYLDLIRVLGNNSIEQTNEYAKSLISSLEILEKQLSELTEAQKTFLQSMEILNYIGNDGINLVNSLINSRYESGHEKREAMDASLSKIDNIRKAFAEYDFGDLAKPDQNQVRMNVRFQGDADISDFTKFENWSKTWKLIAHGFAGAHNVRPEDIQIIGAGQGSIILYLQTQKNIIISVSAVILTLLTATEQVQNIRKQALEINQLKAQEHLTNAAESIEKNKLEEAVQEQIKALNLQQKRDGEIIAALKKSIELLDDFLQKGGEIKFILPPQPKADEDKSVIAEDADLIQIRENTEKIKRIENQLKQIANEQQGILSAPPQKDQEPNETNNSKNETDL